MTTRLRITRFGVCAVVFSVLLFSGCDLFKTDEEDPSSPELGLFETDDARVPYLALHEEGAALSGFVDPETGRPERTVYWTEDGGQVDVLLDENGWPKEMVIGNVVVLFDNITERTADVALVLPDGDVKIARAVDFAARDTTLSSLARVALGKGQGENEILRTVQAFGLALGIASCSFDAALFAGIAAGATGVGAPVAAVTIATCLGAVVSILREANPPESVVSQVGAETVSAYSAAASLIACNPSPSGAVNCIQAFTGAVSTVADFNDDVRSQMERSRALAEGALRTGNGDVKVTLTWENEADLDLWVTDPSGERIGWSHRGSASGGQLDVDDTDGFGPENIFWPFGGAPRGLYKVEVNHYSGPAPVSFDVFMQVAGQVTQLRGFVQDDQWVTVNTFRVEASGTVTKVASPEAILPPARAVKPY